VRRGHPALAGHRARHAEATIAALEEALESDFVLSSGGVSVGAFDFVKDALDALGAESKFWRVSMKRASRSCSPVCATG
jgi:molybdopterin molybdotransferase